MKTLRFAIILSLQLLLVNPLITGQSNNFEISKNLDIYSTLMKELDRNYAENINSTDLTETAIDAMLESLDPYTVFIPESQAEDYKLMTTGQYGGIGALIHKQGDFVVISEPYEGSPAQKAGLKAGDKIIAINGKDAKGKSSEEVSEILKGQPGVVLDLTVQGYSDAEPVTRQITRENIQIPNIPYYGMVNDNIGYINLSNFTKNAGEEVKRAFLDLKEKNDLTGIILDLRGNGGGLLNEAVTLTNIFVDKGKLIVSTKGKVAAKNNDYYAMSPAVDAEIPLVVLVNDNSASASEIVAGAIQDLDRGVIIGQRTFGKGLVQNVIPLSYNSQLKVTVAKYYIPSGRCIQAIDYFHKDNNGDSKKIPDSLINEFKTSKGRKVYDGGGIEPDIVMEEETLSNISRILLTKYLVFDYATKYAAENPSIDSAGVFFANDDIFNDFIAFLKDKNYSYKTRTEEYLDQLKNSAMKENYFEAIEADFTMIKEKLENDKQSDLVKHKDEIQLLLTEEIVSRYYYQKGRIVSDLNHDKEIEKAIEILNQKDNYFAILDGTASEKN